MAEAQQEKRAARRFALRIPVSVARGENTNHTEAAQIRDVSARGICFYLDSPIEQGSPLGFTLTLPPEITLTESIRVQCKGRVVRVKALARKEKWPSPQSSKNTNFFPKVEPERRRILSEQPAR